MKNPVFSGSANALKRAALKGILLTLLVLLQSTSFAQSALSPKDPARPKWTLTEPFSQKVFIENKGQYDGYDKPGNPVADPDPSKAIRYTYHSQGVAIYFTMDGIIFRHDKIDVKQEEEDLAGRKRKRKEREEPPAVTPFFVHMNWAGASPDRKLIAQEPVPYYFTYGDTKDPSGTTTIKANAFKKLVYKNLYPGIDAEYTFPEGKEGFKYQLIVHPGADPSVIRMYYPGGVKADLEGNIDMNSPFGVITDHKPLTTQPQNNTIISSSFQTDQQTVSFAIGNYDHTRDLVIDPWVTNPNFPGYNAAYDIEYDNNGNCYVYGGQGGTINPYSVMKLNNAGAIQWVYQTTPFNACGFSMYYGGFAVDARSGSNYICEAACLGTGGKVIKLNNAGAQIALFPGNPNLEEQWRIVFNSCVNRAIIAGGGTAPTYQASVLDTNCVTMNPVNVLGASDAYHDMVLLAIDNQSFCYMATTNNTVSGFNNVMLRANAATLSPTVFQVFDNHAFVEIGSVTYVNGSTYANGFNGMAVSNNFLYTYDGNILQKWNKTAGTLVSSVVVSGTPYTYGGLDVDDCDNIYVGCANQVKLYNVNLTLVSTTNVTNTVYDVKLGVNSNLFVCGMNFVQELAINTTCNPMTLNASSTGSSCSSNSGTATVNASGGNGPYTYSWVPSNQTTQTATGLASGTYTVYVTDASCIPKTDTAIVVVTNTGGLTITTAQTNLQCATSTSGNASVTVSGGQSPYTYSWTTSPPQTTSSATGLSPGNYTCYITDGTGCTVTQTFTITAPPALTLSATPTNVLCNGNSTGSATAAGGGGVGPYTYSWNNSQTGATATGLGAGTYTVYMTDANGCTTTQTVTITQPNAITANATPTNTSCGNTNGTTTVNASGGTGPLTYSWAPGGQTSSTATGLGAGNYTCYITDANGCTQTATTAVNNSNGPNASLQSQTNLLCNGVNNGTATVSVTNGTAPYTYSWSGNGGSAQTATGLSGGTYTCYVTDANGCTTSQTVTISQPPAITAATSTTFASCGANDGTASVNAAGGTGSLTYSWAPSGGTGTTASGLAIGIYTVYVTDANGCTQTATATVTNASGPTATVGPNVTITGGTSTPLSGNGGGTYSWSPATGLSCTTCQNPVANPTVTTQYCLTVTDPSGCTDTECMTVFVDIPCPSTTEFDVPNAFSPNGDGHNDVFNLQGLRTCTVDFLIIIYDRWGEKVYESTDITGGWDGTYKGKSLDPAVFVYYIRATLVSSGEEIVKRGNVSLVK